MKNQIRNRIDLVRAILKRECLDAFYFSGTDPHRSEYLCDHWQLRRFLTGFTGSFGEVVITAVEAGLWTDSRYFLQAEAQLEGTGIHLFKLRVPGEVTVTSWLCATLPQGSRVGADPESLPYEICRVMSENLMKRKISLELIPGVPEEIWSDRPDLPHNPVFGLEHAVTGETCREKRSRINEILDGKGAGITLVTALDELAWTFNLRGSDVAYNPVFMGYAVTGKTFSHLFLNDDMLPVPLKERLREEGITCSPYSAFFPFLSDLRDQTVYLDPSQVNTLIYTTLASHCRIIEGASVPGTLKAVKNRCELDGFRDVMLKDGAAMVGFLKWLDDNRESPDVTEFTVAEKVREFRSIQPGFQGESFAPIVGYGDHGAIVHYTVDARSAYALKPEGVLLLDSGGQYLSGTTDITRTVALGEVTEQQKTDFTLVLKGLIALSSVTFPEGTKGIHLDSLARLPLWSHGLDYGHGTGHGVGHFLNVHEGPASIRREWNPYEIRPGMVITNEPGIYRQGEYGIRIENMMVCVEKQSTPFGKFLGFETLTLCPVDLNLVISSLLTPEEKNWLNGYHERVRRMVTPFLHDSLIRFLEEKTREIH